MSIATNTSFVTVDRPLQKTWLFQFANLSLRIGNRQTKTMAVNFKLQIIAILISSMALSLYNSAFCQDFGVPERKPAEKNVTQEKIASEKSVSLRSERDIVFLEGDGFKVGADLYRPDSDKIYPIIIMIHGGAWITGDKWHVTDHARQMASNGFVVMAINYRLSPKFQWPTHLEDCFSALNWMKNHCEEWHGDTNNVGVWGYSAGAHLALMMATNPREDLPRLKAVVAGGAPCDLTFIPENTKALATFLGGTRAEFPDRYRDASPISFVTPEDPPVYFFHGDTDFLVPLENSIRMRDKLIAVGVKTIHRTVTGKGHLIAFLDQQSRLEAIDFLTKYLK